MPTESSARATPAATKPADSPTPVDLLPIGALDRAVRLRHLGDLDTALAELQRARSLVRDEPDALASVELEIGLVCLRKYELGPATGHLETALRLARQGNRATMAARALVALGDAARGREDPQRALELYDDVPRTASTDDAPLAAALLGRAQLAREANDLLVAQRDVDEAVALAENAAKRGTDELPLWSAALCAQGEILGATGNVVAGKRSFRKALALVGDLAERYPHALGRCYLAYGLFVGTYAAATPELFSDPPAHWLIKAQEILRAHGAWHDLTEVREALRRYGRRATDRVAEVEVLRVLREMVDRRAAVRAVLEGLSTSSALLAESGTSAENEAGRDRPREIQRLATEARARLEALSESEPSLLHALNRLVVEREGIKMVVELAGRLLACPDLPATRAAMVRLASQMTSADRAVLFAPEEGGRALRAVETHGIGPSEADPLAELAETVRDAGAPRLLLLEPESAQRLVPGGAEPERLARALACPIAQGVLYLDKEISGGRFTERDLERLALFASQAAAMIEKAGIAADLEREAEVKSAMLETLREAVISFDGRGVVSALNEAAARLLDLDRKAAVGSISVHADLPALHAIAGALRAGSDLDGLPVELGDRPYLVTARVLHPAGGAIGGIVVTLTERRRAEEDALRLVASPARFSLRDIIGESPGMRAALRMAETAARSSSSVLILGESGTGKEVFAQAIHNASSRAAGPFLAINCAAIPRELIESELFGYEAGAFTGAKRGGHPGKFELARGGTLLLDEIGDMPLEMQVKLLRVLQERRVQRLGGTRDIAIDAQIVATTHRDLTSEVAGGRFRGDLYYRMNVIAFTLPPLRERRADLPALLLHLVTHFARRLGRDVREVSPEVLRAFLDYPWPGNVRELENVIEREINLSPPEARALVEIPAALRRLPEPAARGHEEGSLDLQSGELLTVEAAERILIRRALERCEGNIPAAAQAIGVSRATAYNMIKRFGLEIDQYRRR